jgi:lysozyme
VIRLRQALLLGGGATLLVACGDEPERSAERFGEAASAAVVCPDDDELEGIDVSYYQDQPNWDAVAADGIAFAITRVNHGDFLDPEFNTNWAAIRDVGMIRGAYQYFDPGGDPEEQAMTFIDQVGELGPGDLPGVIDVESTDGLSPQAIADNVATWLELVEAGTGRKPIIYTGSYFWNDNVMSDAFVEHPLWIAHYTNTCPNLPTVWNGWTFWQYSSTGSVSGIAGNVDTNVFNGNIEELHDLAANGYRADVISVTAPDALAPGEVGEVEIVLENLGGRTWGTDVKLGTTMPRDRESAFSHEGWEAPSRPLALEAEVGTGETVTLTFSLIAPAEAGVYTESFNLVREGVAWFSDTPPGGGPLDDAITITVQVTGDGDPPDDVDPGGEGGGTVKVVAVVTGEASCAVNPPPRGGTSGWLALIPALGWLRRRASRARGRSRRRARPSRARSR